MVDEIKFDLTDDDKRVGQLNPDGTVKSWPKQRIDGEAFSRTASAYSSLRVSDRHFVIVKRNSDLSAKDVRVSTASKPTMTSVIPPAGKDKDSV
jgi:hypothetical protein